MRVYGKSELIVSLAVLIAGCAKEVAFYPAELSDEGRQTYRMIELVEGLATNDVSCYASYGDSLKKSLESVTRKDEKVWLLNNLEQRITSINYDDMPPSRSEYAYLVVGDAFCAIQDVSYGILDGRAAALEVWFREMSYFTSELKHCKQKYQEAEISRNNMIKNTYQGRIDKCKTVMAKTLYRIDFENHLAELYCREHPEKQEEFVQRVKELIGRYPEWYKNDKPVSD